MLQYSPIHVADQVYLEIDLDPTFEKNKDLDPAWWMSSGFHLNFKPCFYLFYLLFIYLLANDSLGYCFQLKIIQYPLALCCVFGRIWIRFGQDPDSVVECPDPDSTKNPADLSESFPKHWLVKWRVESWALCEYCTGIHKQQRWAQKKTVLRPNKRWPV